MNGIRAIAALAVVFSHINLNLPRFNLPGFPALQLASFGVTIFFALSGFLITYLLLHEKKQTQSVDITKFYFRRIFRIWPLYFLYILLVLAYFGSEIIDDRLSYYLFIIPNVAFAIKQTIPLLVHYWSLGVEEQFYLVWPGLVKKVQHLAKFLIVFIFVFLLIKLGLKFLDLKELSVFFHYTRFGCMAIGSLGAWMYFYKKESLLLLNNIWIQVVSWLCMVLIAFNAFHIYSIIDHEIVAVVTVILIYNQIQSTPIISLNGAVLNYLGKISFGIYVYNPLVIALFEPVLAYYSIDSLAWKHVFIFSVIPMAVILISHLSYKYFETRFLNIKEKFVVVASSSVNIK